MINWFVCGESRVQRNIGNWVNCSLILPLLALLLLLYPPLNIAIQMFAISLACSTMCPLWSGYVTNRLLSRSVFGFIRCLQAWLATAHFICLDFDRLHKLCHLVLPDAEVGCTWTQIKFEFASAATRARCWMQLDMWLSPTTGQHNKWLSLGVALY